MIEDTFRILPKTIHSNMFKFGYDILGKIIAFWCLICGLVASYTLIFKHHYGLSTVTISDIAEMDHNFNGDYIVDKIHCGKTFFEQVLNILMEYSGQFVVCIC